MPHILAVARAVWLPALALASSAAFDTLVLQPSDTYFSVGVMDPGGRYALFGTAQTSPPAIVTKVDLSGPSLSRNESLVMEAYEGLLTWAIIDGSGWAYFAVGSLTPARIVQVEHSSMSRAGAVDLLTGENEVACGFLRYTNRETGQYLYTDVAAGPPAASTIVRLYLGLAVSPGLVVILDITGGRMVRERSLVLQSNLDRLTFAFMPPDPGRWAVFATGSAPARVVSVDLTDPLTPRPASTITLAPDENYIRSGVGVPLAPGATVVNLLLGTYTEEARTPRIALNTSTGLLRRTGELTVSSAAYFRTGILGPDGETAYFATDVSGGNQLVRYGVRNIIRTGSLDLDAPPGQVWGLNTMLLLPPHSPGALAAAARTGFGASVGGGEPTFAVLATYSRPGSVLLVNLSSMALVDELRMPPGDESPSVCAADTSVYYRSGLLPAAAAALPPAPAGSSAHVYLTTTTRPSAVILYDAAARLRVSELRLPMSDGTPRAMVFNPAARELLVAMYSDDGYVVRVSAGPSMRVLGNATYEGPAGPINQYQCAAINGNGSSALFGTDTAPGSIVRVDTRTLQLQAAPLLLPPGEDSVAALSFLAASGDEQAVFFTYTQPILAGRLRVADMVVTERLWLQQGENNALVCVTDHRHARSRTYVGNEWSPGLILIIDTMPKLVRVAAISLDAAGSEAAFLLSAMLTPTAVYFGCDTSPGVMVRLDLNTSAVTTVSLPPGDDKLVCAVSLRNRTSSWSAAAVTGAGAWAAAPTGLVSALGPDPAVWVASTAPGRVLQFADLDSAFAPAIPPTPPRGYSAGQIAAGVLALIGIAAFLCLAAFLGCAWSLQRRLRSQVTDSLKRVAVAEIAIAHLAHTKAASDAAAAARTKRMAGSRRLNIGEGGGLGDTGDESFAAEPLLPLSPQLCDLLAATLDLPTSSQNSALAAGTSPAPTSRFGALAPAMPAGQSAAGPDGADWSGVLGAQGLTRLHSREKQAFRPSRSSQATAAEAVGDRHAMARQSISLREAANRAHRASVALSVAASTSRSPFDPHRRSTTATLTLSRRGDRSSRPSSMSVQSGSSALGAPHHTLPRGPGRPSNGSQAPPAQSAGSERLAALTQAVTAEVLSESAQAAEAAAAGWGGPSEGTLASAAAEMGATLPPAMLQAFVAATVEAAARVLADPEGARRELAQAGMSVGQGEDEEEGEEGDEDDLYGDSVAGLVPVMVEEGEGFEPEHAEAMAAQAAAAEAAAAGTPVKRIKRKSGPAVAAVTAVTSVGGGLKHAATEARILPVTLRGQQRKLLKMTQSQLRIATDGDAAAAPEAGRQTRRRGRSRSPAPLRARNPARDKAQMLELIVCVAAKRAAVAVAEVDDDFTRSLALATLLGQQHGIGGAEAAGEGGGLPEDGMLHSEGGGHGSLPGDASDPSPHGSAEHAAVARSRSVQASTRTEGEEEAFPVLDEGDLGLDGGSAAAVAAALRLRSAKAGAEASALRSRQEHLASLAPAAYLAPLARCTGLRRLVQHALTVTGDVAAKDALSSLTAQDATAAAALLAARRITSKKDAQLRGNTLRQASRKSGRRATAVAPAASGTGAGFRTRTPTKQAKLAWLTVQGRQLRTSKRASSFGPLATRRQQTRGSIAGVGALRASSAGAGLAAAAAAARQRSQLSAEAVGGSGLGPAAAPGVKSVRGARGSILQGLRGSTGNEAPTGGSFVGGAPEGSVAFTMNPLAGAAAGKDRAGSVAAGGGSGPDGVELTASARGRASLALSRLVEGGSTSRSSEHDEEGETPRDEDAGAGVRSTSVDEEDDSGRSADPSPSIAAWEDAAVARIVARVTWAAALSATSESVRSTFVRAFPCLRPCCQGRRAYSKPAHQRVGVAALPADVRKHLRASADVPSLNLLGRAAETLAATNTPAHGTAAGAGAPSRLAAFNASVGGAAQGGSLEHASPGAPLGGGKAALAAAVLAFCSRHSDGAGSLGRGNAIADALPALLAAHRRAALAGSGSGSGSVDSGGEEQRTRGPRVAGPPSPVAAGLPVASVASNPFRDAALSLARGSLMPAALGPGPLPGPITSGGTGPHDYRTSVRLAAAHQQQVALAGGASISTSPRFPGSAAPAAGLHPFHVQQLQRQAAAANARLNTGIHGAISAGAEAYPHRQFVAGDVAPLTVDFADGRQGYAHLPGTLPPRASIAPARAIVFSSSSYADLALPLAPLGLASQLSSSGAGEGGHAAFSTTRDGGGGVATSGASGSSASAIDAGFQLPGALMRPLALGSHRLLESERPAPSLQHSSEGQPASSPPAAAAVVAAASLERFRNAAASRSSSRRLGSVSSVRPRASWMGAAGGAGSSKAAVAAGRAASVAAELAAELRDEAGADVVHADSASIKDASTVASDVDPGRTAVNASTPSAELLEPPLPQPAVPGGAESNTAVDALLPEPSRAALHTPPLNAASPLPPAAALLASPGLPHLREMPVPPPAPPPARLAEALGAEERPLE